MANQFDPETAGNNEEIEQYVFTSLWFNERANDVSQAVCSEGSTTSPYFEALKHC
jgi:hypothetical protein